MGEQGERLPRPGDDSTISLLDFFSIVVRKKWLIFFITVAVAVVVLGFLCTTVVVPPTSRWNLLPNRYRPVAQVLIQDNSSTSNLSSYLNQSSVGSLTGMLGGANLLGKSTSAALAQALTKGRTIEDEVAQKFDFATKYKLQKNAKSAARGRYEAALKVRYDDKSGLLSIGYEDTDPQFAAGVVNEIVGRLQDQFSSLTTGKVASRRAYLEKSIANQQTEEESAALRLSDFQKAHGVYDLSAQTQANISALASLQGELTAKQTDLELQSKYIPESDMRIVLLKDQIKQLQGQIEVLRTGTARGRNGSVSLSQMVDMASEYASLKADVQVQQAVLLTLKQQYEAAKLEEQDTSPSFQIVERAEVPETRSGPGRAKIEIIATLVGFVVSILVAFVEDYFEKARLDPVEAQKLAAIRSGISLRKKKG